LQRKLYDYNGGAIFDKYRNLIYLVGIDFQKINAKLSINVLKWYRISVSFQKRRYVFSVKKYRCKSWMSDNSFDRIINAFELRCYKFMLKVRWKDKVSNREFFNEFG